jgi:hypothetical protein
METFAPAIPFFLRCVYVAACAAYASNAQAGVGADISWTTYEAEAMKTTGAVMGPGYSPNSIETESSGQKYVRLVGPGEFVEFTAAADANALVLRYSLPDAAEGGGTNTSLALFVNGREVRRLALTSRYSWLYGTYPFSNDPAKGKPRNFYDELRLKDLNVARNDVIRLQRVTSDTAYCIIDLVDLENVPAPLAAPANALSLLDFGADRNGEVDAADALRKCVAEAQVQNKPVWVPAGDYKVTGEIRLPSSVTIQGAGMWHTTFVGDPTVYNQAARRVRFKLAGSHIHLADFSIMGRLNYRNDNEPNDGIIGAGCSDSSISRIWIEHTKVGIWIYNGVNLAIDGCRLRNTIADGVNLCVGTSGTVIENCTTRGTGDDCFAIWPAASDQGFVGNDPPSGNNVIRRCTGQLTFLANGAAIYGGVSNHVEDCLFTDIGTGCGILISTTFPTSDEKLKIDNNFSGTTLVKNCELLRCGGYDHDWAWRGSLQICMDRRSISGLTISHVAIRDSISSGLTIVAPGGLKGEGTLSQARIEQVNIANAGIGGSPHHDLWIDRDVLGSVALVDSPIADIRNESDHFRLVRH